MSLTSDSLVISLELIVHAIMIGVLVVLILLLTKGIRRSLRKIKIPLLHRLIKTKKRDYYVIHKDQINELKGLLESRASLEKSLLDLTLANDSKASLPSDKRVDLIFDNDTFEVYRIEPDEFIVFVKPLQEYLNFEVEKRNEGIMTEEGYLDDEIEDVIISIDGEPVLEFDGRYI